MVRTVSEEGVRWTQHFCLPNEVEAWLCERGENPKLFNSNIIINDDTFAVEFKLVWL
jgi:hypothetical protein